VLPVSLFLSRLRNNWSSYYLLVNIGGFSNRSDRYSAVVGFTGGMTIAGLGLIFRVLASSNGDRS